MRLLRMVVEEARVAKGGKVVGVFFAAIRKPLEASPDCELGLKAGPDFTLFPGYVCLSNLANLDLSEARPGQVQRIIYWKLSVLSNKSIELKIFQLLQYRKLLLQPYSLILGNISNR
jgi:hypothetical protein